jgi:hypothetical protein
LVSVHIRCPALLLAGMPVPVSQGVHTQAGTQPPEDVAELDAIEPELDTVAMEPVLEAIDPVVVDMEPPGPVVATLELDIPPMPDMVLVEVPVEDDDLPPLPVLPGPQIPSGQPVVVVVAFPPPPPHIVSDRAPPMPRAVRANRKKLRGMLSS